MSKQKQFLIKLVLYFIGACVLVFGLVAIFGEHKSMVLSDEIEMKPTVNWLALIETELRLGCKTAKLVTELD